MSEIIGLARSIALTRFREAMDSCMLNWSIVIPGWYPSQTHQALLANIVGNTGPQNVIRALV